MTSRRRRRHGGENGDRPVRLLELRASRQEADRRPPRQPTISLPGRSRPTRPSTPATRVVRSSTATASSSASTSRSPAPAARRARARAARSASASRSRRTSRKRVSDEIIENGEATHGLLGASVHDASSRRQSTSSARSSTRSPPAARPTTAGLKAGDVVTEFDGIPITSSTDLTAQVRALAAGADARAHLRAATARRTTVDVTLGELDG